MADARQSLAQLIMALATKELAAASLLDALATKINEITCSDADCIQVLTLLKELTCETLALTMKWDKADLESVTRLLDHLAGDEG